MNLLRADTIPAGSEIWAEDDEQVWMLAEVLRQENTLLTVRQKSTGDELEIDLVRYTYQYLLFLAAFEGCVGTIELEVDGMKGTLN